MNVWMVAGSVVSPLGVTTAENFNKLTQNCSGISSVTDTALSDTSFFAAHIKGLPSVGEQTRFETISRLAATVALEHISLNKERTIYILSTTKGNISLLEHKSPDHVRLQLHHTAKWLAAQCGLHHYLVVSNACISGILALITAKRLLESPKYDHAVVVGADVLSRFVVSGFQSLMALSDSPCKPFDAKRNGINLGEAAGAVVLSTKPEDLGIEPTVKIIGGGLSNDANHISGPSRTGDELGFAIQQAMVEANLRPDQIDFISAHGTATVFNDEMEAKAFHNTGMSNVPLNSLKGYFGHTLGAAGIIETVMSRESLMRNEILATRGFEISGVSVPVNVTQDHIAKPLTTCLKTASGFGGCNAAIVLKKEHDAS